MKSPSRLWPLIASLLLSGCAVTDYSAGVTSFSKAVTAQTDAEAALIERADHARTSEWLDQIAKHPGSRVTVDLLRCETPTGYRPGDCSAISGAYGRPPRPTPSSTKALDDYAKMLAAVTVDADCATISSDASSLSTSIKGLTATLHASRVDADISPLVSLATAAGCRTLSAYRLDILRKATFAANPAIQQLVGPIQRKESTLARIVVRDAAAQVDAAMVAYRNSPSRAQLQTLLQLTAAADAAQQVSLDRSMAAIARVHGRLTQDLQGRRIDLTHIISEAQLIVDDANLAKAALRTLAADEGGRPLERSKDAP